MIPRLVKKIVRERLRSYPAVALIGPRQCGKTTLAQSFRGRYFDLELESDRFKLDLAWPDVSARPGLTILDEAQAWPGVFPLLRSAIDKDRRRAGRFLLLGSVSPSLMRQVSESLAGRLSLVELSPLLLSEVGPERLDDLWLCGGFPEGGVLDAARYPRWQSDYLALLTQRDLPAWGLPAPPQVTERLLRMVAAVHGQVWNASQIGRSLGLNFQTVNRYVDYLAGAFMLRRIPPYHANIKKRLVKSPKLFWRDSGLVHARMLVRDMDSLLSQPWVGSSWEGFVIEQVLGHMSAWGAAYDAYHMRTSDQYEIDLVVDLGGELWAVEAKLTSSPSVGDRERLEKSASLIGADRCILVSRTRDPVAGRRVASTDLPGLLRMLKKRLGSR